jgi:hypothetical protein
MSLSDTHHSETTHLSLLWLGVLISRLGLCLLRGIVLLVIGRHRGVLGILLLLVIGLLLIVLVALFIVLLLGSRIHLGARNWLRLAGVGHNLDRGLWVLGSISCRLLGLLLLVVCLLLLVVLIPLLCILRVILLARGHPGVLLALAIVVARLIVARLLSRVCLSSWLLLRLIIV